MRLFILSVVIYYSMMNTYQLIGVSSPPPIIDVLTFSVKFIKEGLFGTAHYSYPNGHIRFMFFFKNFLDTVCIKCKKKFILQYNIIEHCVWWSNAKNLHPGEVYHPMYKLSGVGIPIFHKMILILSFRFWGLASLVVPTYVTL